MRIADYVLVAVKDLRRQSVRSTLTIVALTISTIIVVTMAAISIGGQQAITGQLSPDNSLATIVVTPNQSDATLSPFGSVQQVKPSAGKLTDATVSQLIAIPHVSWAMPQAHIWEFHHFSIEGSDKQFVAQAEGIPGDAQLSVAAGSRFAPNDSRHVVIIGAGYAKELGFTANPKALTGKTMQIITQKGYRGDGATIPPSTAQRADIDAFNQSQTTLTATIIGVTDSGADQNSIFVPLDWARAIRTARYNESGGVKTVDQLTADGYATIKLRADATGNVKAIAAAIDAMGYGQIATLAQLERLQQFTTLLWVILGSVAVIAVVAAALGVVNTMLMAVSEQRYAIGVWRACGARRRTIVGMFLLQAGLLGLAGGAIGAALGVAASQAVNSQVGALLQAQGLNNVNLAMTPLWLLASTVVLTTGFGVAAGLYPAYRAARQDPSAILNSGQ